MSVTIRLATADDAAQVREIYAPFCLDSHVSFELEPPSLAEMRARIAGTIPAFPWLVAEADGRVLGYAYAGKHQERAAYAWAANVSIYIRDGQRGAGLGRALYTSLFHLLRAQGFFMAAAGATLPNPASEGLHQAMGFQPVGIYRNIGYKTGAWRDVIWWQLTLQHPFPNPPPPKSLDAIRDSAEWDQAIAAGLACLAESHGAGGSSR